jgi:hypothetical protein
MRLRSNLSWYTNISIAPEHEELVRQWLNSITICNKADVMYHQDNTILYSDLVDLTRKTQVLRTKVSNTVTPLSNGLVYQRWEIKEDED